ncbi:unnamed protein product, partial [Closterium sp. NIES-54]
STTSGASSSRHGPDGAGSGVGQLLPRHSRMPVLLQLKRRKPPSTSVPHPPPPHTLFHRPHPHSHPSNPPSHHLPIQKPHRKHPNSRSTDIRPQHPKPHQHPRRHEPLIPLPRRPCHHISLGRRKPQRHSRSPVPHEVDPEE